MPYTIDGEQLWRCPLSLVEQESWEYIQAYSFYKEGVMPNGGGWIEESKKFIDAMMIVQGQMGKIDKEAIDKAKRKH